MIYILLSTYNGEKYLEEQLESLINQKGVEFKILVRDDGSTDSTTKILNKWQDKGLLTWYQGDNIGVVHSFMDLLRTVPQVDYYAFCDQDDVWLPNKLHRGISFINKVVNKYKLYATAYQMVDTELKLIPTTMMPTSNSFGESLIIQPVPGCTMIFNRNLLELFIKADANHISMHDSWMYKLCLGVGGAYIYDSIPSILYRQHSNNVVGGNQTWYKRWKRRWANLIYGNCYRSKNAIHLLNTYDKELTDVNKVILKDIVSYRTSLLGKLKIIFSNAYITKSKVHNILFRIAILINKY